MSAFFSAAEMAFVGLNRIRIEHLADGGDRRAKRALHIANHFEQALTTILVGNNIANIASAAIVTLLVTWFWGLGSVGWSTIALTGFVFLFCEMLPKSIAKRRSEDVALGLAGALALMMRLLKPVAFIFTAWSNCVKRWVRQTPGPSYTEDELQGIIETIEDEGVLEPEERELMLSAFEFSDITARDILIPMEQVIAIPISAGADQVTEILKQNNLSRFPVYDARRAHVIGMLQANRFYAAMLKGKYKGLRPLLLPVRSYSEHIHIDELMRQLNQRKSHMALIKDDAGRTLGIVTMEDILEELVGEIYDEDDVPPPDALLEGGDAQ